MRTSWYNWFTTGFGVAVEGAGSGKPHTSATTRMHVHTMRKKHQWNKTAQKKKSRKERSKKKSYKIKHPYRNYNGKLQ